MERNAGEARQPEREGPRAGGDGGRRTVASRAGSTASHLTDLGAASWVTSRLTVVLLVAAGALFAFRPRALGWDALVGLLGGETAVLGVGVGAAFALLAALSWEKYQLRVRCAELLEALNQLLYGRDYASHRDAIEILLNALDSRDETARRTAHEHLVRLTGQNFAPDALVWRAWWTAHAKTWAARRGPPLAQPSAQPSSGPSSGPSEGHAPGRGPDGGRPAA